MNVSQLHDQGFDNSTEGEAGEINVACSQCAALVINGTACHEHRCPNTPCECQECGSVHRTQGAARECCDDSWDEWSMSDVDPESES